MNRLLSGLLLLLVLGAGSVPAAVEAAEHTARGTGRAHQDGFSYAFRFRAEGSPSAATGQASIDAGPEGVVTGTVDCLFVEGRRAVLSGVVDSPPQSAPYFAIAVKDDPRNTDRPRDRTALKFSLGPIPCEDADLLTGATRITRGDIVVR